MKDFDSSAAAFVNATLRVHRIAAHAVAILAFFVSL